MSRRKNNNISLNNSSGRLGINSSTWDCASYDQHLYIPGGHPHALHQSDANCGCMHRHIACLVPTVFGWRFVFLTKKKKKNNILLVLYSLARIMQLAYLSCSVDAKLACLSSFLMARCQIYVRLLRVCKLSWCHVSLHVCRKKMNPKNCLVYP